MLKSPAIAITAKVGTILEARIADVRNHPENGILLTIPNNPMAILPLHFVLGESDEVKAARRAKLIAAPNSDILVRAHTISHATDPKGKHRFVVKEVDMEVENKIERCVARLPLGQIIEGTVSRILNSSTTKSIVAKSEAPKGVLVNLGKITGIIIRSELETQPEIGDKIKVVVLSAALEGGQPRVLLSQRQASKLEAEMKLKVMSTSVADLTTLLAQLATIPEGEGVGHSFTYTSICGLSGFSLSLDPLGAPAFIAMRDIDPKTYDALKNNPRPLRVALTNEVLVGRYLRVKLPA